MVDFLLSDLAIVIYEGVLVLFLIINTLRLRKKNKKTAELVSLQLNRIREENLDASLKNNMYISNKNQAVNANNPYDVTYHQEENNVYDDTRERISIQVEEKGILSTKRYVVHVFDAISIGSSDDNTIVLNDLTVARHHVQLMRVANALYIKNMDMNGEVKITRGKRTQVLEMEPVHMESNDVIMVGNTSLKITII